MLAERPSSFFSLYTQSPRHPRSSELRSSSNRANLCFSSSPARNDSHSPPPPPSSPLLTSRSASVPRPRYSFPFDFFFYKCTPLLSRPDSQQTERGFFSPLPRGRFFLFVSRLHPRPPLYPSAWSPASSLVRLFSYFLKREISFPVFSSCSVRRDVSTEVPEPLFTFVKEISLVVFFFCQPARKAFGILWSFFLKTVAVPPPFNSFFLAPCVMCPLFRKVVRGFLAEVFLGCSFYSCNRGKRRFLVDLQLVSRLVLSPHTRMGLKKASLRLPRPAKLPPPCCERTRPPAT